MYLRIDREQGGYSFGVYLEAEGQEASTWRRWNRCPKAEGDPVLSELLNHIVEMFLSEAWLPGDPSEELVAFCKEKAITVRWVDCD